MGESKRRKQLDSNWGRPGSALHKKSRGSQNTLPTASKKTLEELMPSFSEKILSELDESQLDVLVELINESVTAIKSGLLEPFLATAEKDVDAKVFDAFLSYLVMLSYVSR